MRIGSFPTFMKVRSSNSMEGKEGEGHHKHIEWNCALLRAFVSHVRRSLRLGSTPPHFCGVWCYSYMNRNHTVEGTMGSHT